MADTLTALRWSTVDNCIMIASAHACDGELIRLFVGLHSHGIWDWRVWHTLHGAQHRHGVASNAADAAEAAECAAEELSDLSAPSCATATSPEMASRAGDRPLSGPALGSGQTFEKIATAFHIACDGRNLPAAKALLAILDGMISRRKLPEDRRRQRFLDQITAAHVRFWHLLNMPER